MTAAIPGRVLQAAHSQHPRTLVFPCRSAIQPIGCIKIRAISVSVLRSRSIPSCSVHLASVSTAATTLSASYYVLADPGATPEFHATGICVPGVPSKCDPTPFFTRGECRLTERLADIFDSSLPHSWSSVFANKESQFEIQR